MRFIKIYKIIGQNILAKRKELGLSQAQLAEKCGIDRAKISDMENGKEDFMLSTLLQLCEALELSLEEVAKMQD